VSFNYSTVEPITQAIRANRQLAKRHYGVHPYFTRRPPNIVRSYIEHYSRTGDRVLDPFGGSGVTAIEAFLSNRSGIHNDINPLGNFIARGIAEACHRDASYIKQSFTHVAEVCGDIVRRIPHLSEKQVQERLHEVPLPENIELPKNADVRHFYDLFTPGQLLALAILKETIQGVRNEQARAQLLLAWSATAAKLNKTFLSAKGRLESRGGSSVFSIYRYKVAKEPVELSPWNTFEERVCNVIRAKEEVIREIQYREAQGGFRGEFECHEKDVLELPDILEPVDYIFTDPPYGGHIAYLDLSTIWNHWLGFPVSTGARKKEIIVGGELDKSQDEYICLLKASIKACLRLLRRDRWLSIVFQHWDTSYFEAILETAEESGAVLRSAVTQVGDTIWSMHKKKNLERVLMGEMILTFFKDGRNEARTARHNHLDVESLVDKVLPSVAGMGNQFHGELLFNRLIMEAWQQNALHTLRINRDEFIRLLEAKGWRYDPQSHFWVRNRLAPEKKLW